MAGTGKAEAGKVDKDFRFTYGGKALLPVDSGLGDSVQSVSSLGSSSLDNLDNNSYVSVPVQEGFQADKEFYKDQDVSKSTDSTTPADSTGGESKLSIPLDIVVLYFSPDQDGDSYFHIDILNGKSDRVKRMLSVGPPNNLLNLQNEYQMTALHLAVIANRPLELGWLLRAGIDVGLVDKRGYSVWHIAAEKSDPMMLKALVTLYMGSVLPCSVQEAMQQMLHAKSYDGLSPIHLAVNFKRTENVALLFKAGADVNDRDRVSEATPLHYAAKIGYAPLVAELIHLRGAVVGPKLRNGVTPLHLAVAYGHAAVTAILLGAGADANDKTFDGDSVNSLARDETVRKVLQNMSTPLLS